MWNSSGSSSKRHSSSSKRDHHHPASASRKVINEASAEKLFQEIADEDDPTVAGMEGISGLCDHLELDALEDIRILVLLWKLGSKEKPAQITKEEWMAGCNKLQVDTMEKFKELLPSLDTGFLDQMEFKDFYKVCSIMYICCSGWTGQMKYNVMLERLTSKSTHALTHSHCSTTVFISFAFNSIDKGHIEPWTRKWWWP
jgi:hypothetical protein